MAVKKLTKKKAPAKKKVIVKKIKKTNRCTGCSSRRPKAKPKKSKLIVKAIKPSKPDGKLIGKISHYFDNIKVGVVALSKPLSVGDKIRIVGGNDTDFNQDVKSLQEEHKKLQTAKTGHSVGLKVKQKVREGYKVYKLK